MQHYTVLDILALRPCQPTEDRPDAGYPEGKLQRLFGDRRSVTLLEICDDERVPVKDRQWVLHKLLPDRIVHEAVCRYAERALDRERTKGREMDPRSCAAIGAKRQWLRGEISDVDLDAAEAAVWAADRAASSAAAEGDDWDDAWAAERRWQLATLREMIEEMEGRNHQQGENP